jgi:hypothetical protein
VVDPGSLARRPVTVPSVARSGWTPGRILHERATEFYAPVAPSTVPDAPGPLLRPTDLDWYDIGPGERRRFGATRTAARLIEAQEKDRQAVEAPVDYSLTEE